MTQEKFDEAIEEIMIMVNKKEILKAHTLRAKLWIALEDDKFDYGQGKYEEGHYEGFEEAEQFND